MRADIVETLCALYLDSPGSRLRILPSLINSSHLTSTNLYASDIMLLLPVHDCIMKVHILALCSHTSVVAVSRRVMRHLCSSLIILGARGVPHGSLDS